MTSGAGVPPRIFGIIAEDADVAAIIRRGPARWFHVGRWNTLSGSYEGGAWLHGLLYPQRCDLSPDGQLFCYMALHASRWSIGETYIALSKLPWLTALAAWPTIGTWSRGAYFVRDASFNELGPPSMGDLGGLRQKYGLAEASPQSFAVERRRGWKETIDTPARLSSDRWDERRGEHIRLEKVNPVLPDLWLGVCGMYAAFRSGDQRTDVAYELRTMAGTQSLTNIQWAEWDTRGRLLLASDEGHLRIVDVKAGSEVVAEVDLRDMRPDPSPAPVEATLW